MPRYGYIVVEGQHDAAFVYRLLRPCGFDQIRRIEDVDPYYKSLIAAKYRAHGEMQRRVPIPRILASDQLCIAVHASEGDSTIAATVQDSVDFLSAAPDSLGVILDADSEQTPTERFNYVRDSLKEVGITMPENAGDVRLGPPAAGIYVLPDNARPGTLEDVLLECAEKVYPQLLVAARDYIESVDKSKLTEADLKELHNEAAHKKAVISAMASVLKPGKAVQNSIQDNRWLRDEGLSIESVARVSKFLKELLQLN